jgi:hypothetical protein
VAEKAASPRAGTQRVVLLAVNLSTETIAKALPEEQRSLIPGDSQVVWLEIGTATGDKRGAVKAVLGGEVPGVYRAPSRRAWHGGVGFRPPSQQRLEGFTID